MAKTSAQLSDIGQHLDSTSGPIVVLKKTAAPYTTVVNRAQMTDLSQDLGARMGIERIFTGYSRQLYDERGPNNEPVWAPENDLHGQVRFVGTGIANINSTNGPYTEINVNDYVEISFYGTGLNLLALMNGSSRDMRYSLDGASEVASNIYSSTTSSTIITGRSYSQNIIVNVVAGQTLGFHTVKLRSQTGGHSIYGFEILNESSSIKVAKGSSLSSGMMKTLSSVASTSYNSGFESGTLGSRGGRVVLYQKNDGTIGKAVTPTDSSSATYTSANHVNEEVMRTHWFREFGGGSTEDFSRITNGTSGHKTYNLEDNLTALCTNLGTSKTNTSYETFSYESGSSFLTIHFVGTGLDIIRHDSATNGGPENNSVTIDGTATANAISTAATTYRRIEKIVSGLPFGSHVVKIARTSASFFNMGIAGYVVYGPKKPSIPTGAAELCDYYVPANYVANSTAGINNIATGVIRKLAAREFTYVGTWAYPTIDAGSYINAFSARATASSSYVEYVFFGTGFEFRGQANTTFSGTNTMYLQNLTTGLNGAGASNPTIGGGSSTLNNTNWPGLTTSNYGGHTFTYSSGNLSIATSNADGSGTQISGLALGLYRLRVTTGTASTFSFEALDVISPVYAPKISGPFVIQSNLTAGAMGCGDSRNFGNKQLAKKNNHAYSAGILSSPSIDTTAYPVPEMMSTIYSKTGFLTISHTTSMSIASGQDGYCQVFVDGVAVSPEEQAGWNTSCTFPFAQSITVPVSPGWHHVEIFARSTAATSGATTRRHFNVVDGATAQ